jgi:hypothetical protein
VVLVENDEYARFVRRVMRAYARRVADGDVDALADMTGLGDELDEAIGQAVTGLRKAGYSWAEIAARLGVSRQAPSNDGPSGSSNWPAKPCPRGAPERSSTANDHRLPHSTTPRQAAVLASSAHQGTGS